MFSKSRAANFFISDVLSENIRITPLPKVGTCRNLQYSKVEGLRLLAGNRTPNKISVPAIKGGDKLTTTRKHMEDPKEVCEQRFPSA
jgi:hypothetical protein